MRHGRRCVTAGRGTDGPNAAEKGDINAMLTSVGAESLRAAVVLGSKDCRGWWTLRGMHLINDACAEKAHPENEPHVDFRAKMNRVFRRLGAADWCILQWRAQFPHAFQPLRRRHLLRVLLM